MLQGHGYKKSSIADEANKSKVSFLTKVGDINEKEKGKRKRNGNDR